MSRLSDAVRLARDTFATGSWMVLRLAALGFWLLIMAKLVTAADFGWLASILGIAAVSVMLVGAGIPYLFFAVAHECSPRELEVRWSELLGCLIFAGPIVVVVALVAIIAWMPSRVPVLLLLALLTVEILLVGLVQSVALLLHAKRNFDAASGLPAMMTLSRALAAGIALTMDVTLDGYIVMHVLAATVIGALSLIWAKRLGGRLTKPRLPSKETLKSSSSYAVMAAGSLANSELDKPILAGVAGLTVTGQYALAYRVCSAIAMPVTALSASMLPRWTRMSASSNSRGLVRSFGIMLLLVAATSIATSLLLVILLNHFPLRGLGFSGEVLSLMHGLVWIVGPVGLHQLAGTALLSISRPILRTIFDISGLCILAVSFFCSYTRWGVDGLILSSVLVESLIAGLMAISFFASVAGSPRFPKEAVTNAY